MATAKKLFLCKLWSVAPSIIDSKLSSLRAIIGDIPETVLLDYLTKYDLNIESCINHYFTQNSKSIQSPTHTASDKIRIEMEEIQEEENKYEENVEFEGNRTHFKKQISLRITSAKTNATILQSTVYYYFLNQNCQTLSLSKSKNGSEVYFFDLTKCEFQEKNRYEYRIIYQNKIFYFTPSNQLNGRGLTWLLDRVYNIINICSKYTTLMIQEMIGMDLRSRANNVSHLNIELMKIKKVEDPYRLLCNELNQKQLQDFDYRTKLLIRQALKNKNRFWNLLVDTAEFLDDDNIACIDIISNLEDWPDLRHIKKPHDLTQKQYQLMDKGFQSIRKFLQNDKQPQRKKLKKRWQEWRDEYDSLRLQIATEQLNKEQSKEYSTFLENVLTVGGTLFAIGGVVLCILGAVAILSNPVGWIIGGAAGAFAGVVTICGSECSRSEKKHNAKHADEQIRALENADQYLKERWENDYKRIDKWLGDMIKSVKLSQTYARSAKDEYNMLNINKIHWVRDLKDSFMQFSEACKSASSLISEIQQDIINNDTRHRQEMVK